MEKHRISIAELANKIGFTRSYASLVINQRREPSVKFKALVQRLLDMPPLEIIPRDYDHLNHYGSRSYTGASSGGMSDFLNMELEDLETVLHDYITALPAQKLTNKIVSINVMHHILDAIRLKLKQ